jgi:putative phosphoesterase
MRIAIIADIHGNDVALDAVLHDLRDEPADQIVCLGDAIQGGPQPAEVVAHLRELACPVVMGNADAWLLSGEETGSEDLPPERLRKMQAIRAWSLAQLSDADQAYIAQFQPTITLPLTPAQQLLCFHGSPASFDDVILPTTAEDVVQSLLGAYLPNVLTGGHTHMQQLRRLDAGPAFFFNPGSVGFAYSHYQAEDRFRADPWAEYAVLTAQGHRIALEFRRVPFDVPALIARYRASGRPYDDEAIGQYQP